MNRIKYPRTFHVPWSDSNSSDDVWWTDCSPFEGKEVVVTSKLDGECTTIYPDGHTHARSVDSLHHPSRSWIKALAAQIAPDIPKGHRVCGENLYAFHSIFYTDLPAYFFVYGIYDDKNTCLSWDETVEFCELLGLITVPVLYRGVWDEEVIRKGFPSPFPTFHAKSENPEWPDDFEPCPPEGYVIRLAEAFPYGLFDKSVAKYVGKKFRQSMRDVHWASSKVIPNIMGKP